MLQGPRGTPATRALRRTGALWTARASTSTASRRCCTRTRGRRPSPRLMILPLRGCARRPPTRPPQVCTASRAQAHPPGSAQGSPSLSARSNARDNTHAGPPGGVPAACAGTLGDWCQRWFAAPLVPSKPAPRGSKACPNGCNGVGSCNHDLGLCQCPAGAWVCCSTAAPKRGTHAQPACMLLAGWTGDDCRTPLKRPCTARYRASWDSPPAVRGALTCGSRAKGAGCGRGGLAKRPGLGAARGHSTPLRWRLQSHVDVQGHDLDLRAPGSTLSRCPGEGRGPCHSHASKPCFTGAVQPQCRGGQCARRHMHPPKAALRLPPPACLRPPNPCTQGGATRRWAPATAATTRRTGKRPTGAPSA